MDETKEKMLEIEDKRKRRNNVIIYNVVENQKTTSKERMSGDKDFCEKLMNEVLKVGLDLEEGDIQKVIRLGKRTEDDKNRPILVEFSSGQVKNLIMENAGKLGNAIDEFKGVTISHDMTKAEREQCREMVEEAKLKQSNETGNWVHKVRGLPGLMKVVSFQKY